MAVASLLENVSVIQVTVEVEVVMDRSVN